MTRLDEKLSAYIDGELSEAEAREIEDALEADPALRAEMKRLLMAEALIQEAFEAELDDPVPDNLVQAIQDAPSSGRPANAPSAPGFWPRLAQTAAAVALLGFGAAGGYFVGQAGMRDAPPARNWIAEISEYHGLYAKQVRHLVEVPASEADHLQTWLTSSIGVEVVVPDLTDLGLTFEGGRLLSAAGKPVGQLMYRDQTGAVVALCMVATETPREGFTSAAQNGFEIVSWAESDTAYVVIGDPGRSDLADIAVRAADRV